MILNEEREEVVGVCLVTACPTCVCYGHTTIVLSGVNSVVSGMVNPVYVIVRTLKINKHHNKSSNHHLKPTPKSYNRL